MKPWDEASESERREYLRLARELAERPGIDVRDRLAGVIPLDADLEAALVSPANVVIGGRRYGVLMSGALDVRFEEVRLEMIRQHAEQEAPSHAPGATTLVRRVIELVGRAYVDVEPPHAELGAEPARLLPFPLVLALFDIAYSRRPRGQPHAS